MTASLIVAAVLLVVVIDLALYGRWAGWSFGLRWWGRPTPAQVLSIEPLRGALMKGGAPWAMREARPRVRATVGGQPLDLTYTEFELLKYLVAHPGRVLTREQLLSEVWGYDYYGGARTVDVHIRRLRAKLGPEYDAWISTVRNVGYRFGANR